MDVNGQLTWISDLTGLLYTKDQPSRILNCVSTLVSEPIKFKVLILDGSESYNEEVAHLAEGTSHICYHHMPGILPIQRILMGYEMVETSYVLPMADHYHLVMKTVKKCVEFLKINPDYAAAQGARFWKSVDQTGGAQFRLGQYAPSLDHDDPLKRLQQHADSYALTIWSVYPKEIFLERAEFSFSSKIDCIECPVFAEIILSMFVVAKGKVKCFPDPSLITKTVDKKFYLMPREWQKEHPAAFEKAMACAESIDVFRSVFTRDCSLRDLMRNFMNRDAFRRDHENIIRFINAMQPDIDAIKLLRSLAETKSFADILCEIETQIKNLDWVGDPALTEALCNLNNYSTEWASGNKS